METCHGLEIGGKALAGQNRVEAVFKRLERCFQVVVLLRCSRSTLVPSS